MKKLSIFLSDDHTIVREGLKRVIETERDMQVVGDAGKGRETIRRVLELRPDIVVLDVSMPDMGGVEVALGLKEKWPEVKIVALTVHEDEEYSREILAAGAQGYVLKRSAASELISAIRKVAAGKIHVDPCVSDHLVRTLFNSEEEVESEKLSAREQSVLKLIAQGHSNKDVARQLGLSVKSIETYKARATEKLRLRSRVDIVRYAHKYGWLEK